jgi:hypothetical protein
MLTWRCASKDRLAAMRESRSRGSSMDVHAALSAALSLSTSMDSSSCSSRGGRLATRGNTYGYMTGWSKAECRQRMAFGIEAGPYAQYNPSWPLQCSLSAALAFLQWEGRVTTCHTPPGSLALVC